MLTYRFATLNDDLTYLTEIGLSALKELTLHKDNPPDKEEFKKTIKAFISAPSCALLLVEEEAEIIGLIAFTIIPDMLFPSKGTVALEVLLWIRQDKRAMGVFREILRIYEKAAKAVGCHKICLSCLETPEEARVAKLYQHVGFKRMETTFVKELE